MSKITREDLQAAPYAAVGLVRGVWEQEPAITMWGATLGLALGYDTWAAITGRETMSHAYHRGMEHPMMKYMCVGAMGILALHLCHETKAPSP